MCMSNYFLMYVIPSVMVQSYICYVTKPIVEVELSKFSDLALILSADIWGMNFQQSKRSFRKKETDSDWSQGSSQNASGDPGKEILFLWSLLIIQVESINNQTVLPFCWQQI